MQGMASMTCGLAIVNTFHIEFLKYGNKLLPKDTLCKLYRGIVEPHLRTAVRSGGHVGVAGAAKTSKPRI